LNRGSRSTKRLSFCAADWLFYADILQRARSSQQPLGNRVVCQVIRGYKYPLTIVCALTPSLASGGAERSLVKLREAKLEVLDNILEAAADPVREMNVARREVDAIFLILENEIAEEKEG
jgi:hypothetical protein